MIRSYQYWVYTGYLACVNWYYLIKLEHHYGGRVYTECIGREHGMYMAGLVYADGLSLLIGGRLCSLLCEGLLYDLQ